MTTRTDKTLVGLLGFLIASSLTIVPACSSAEATDDTSEEGEGTLPLPNADVDPPADIKLHPDVVVIHGGLSVLKRVSADHTVWTLEKSAAGVSSLAPGKIVLLAGLDVARVAGVVDRGSQLDISVLPVAFGEVITDGTITWDKDAIDPERSLILRAPKALYGQPPEPASSPTTTASLDGRVRPLDALPTEDGTLKVQLGDNWTFTYNARKAGNGLDLTIAGQRNIGGGTEKLDREGTAKLGAIEIGVNAKVHIENVKSTSGSLRLSGGTMSDGSLNTDIAGSVDVDATARSETKGQFPSQALIRLPIAIEYAFPCMGGLPCYLSYQVAFIIQPSLASTNSGIGVGGHFDYRGTAGIKLAAGTAEHTGQVTAEEPPDLLAASTVVPSVGTTAMVFVIQAPRIGVGLGTLSAVGGAKIGVFADVVNSFGITAASAAAPVPCRAINWKLSASVGGEMSVKVFDTVTLSEQTKYQVYEKKKDFFSPDIPACRF
jgi:hypothetical protein